jgi:hypothetical protein
VKRSGKQDPPPVSPRFRCSRCEKHQKLLETYMFSRTEQFGCEVRQRSLQHAGNTPAPLGAPREPPGGRFVNTWPLLTGGLNRRSLVSGWGGGAGRPRKAHGKVPQRPSRSPKRWGAPVLHVPAPPEPSPLLKALAGGPMKAEPSPGPPPDVEAPDARNIQNRLKPTCV